MQYLRKLNPFSFGKQLLTKSKLSSQIQEEAIVGPGGRKGEMPTALEQSTGLERLEYLAKLKGESVFLSDTLTVTEKGTLKKPTMIDSLEDERVVGCSGVPKFSHDIMWMMVKKDAIHRCPECGQAFKLKMLETGEPHHH